MNQGNQASHDRAAYDSRAADLIGLRVLEVMDWDVHNFADEPRRWDYGDWHHAVMGVDLLTERGPSCVLWTDTFFPDRAGRPGRRRAGRPVRHRAALPLLTAGGIRPPRDLRGDHRGGDRPPSPRDTIAAPEGNRLPPRAPPGVSTPPR